jgi:hypothetical protein
MLVEGESSFVQVIVFHAHRYVSTRPEAPCACMRMGVEGVRVTGIEGMRVGVEGEDRLVGHENGRWWQLVHTFGARCIGVDVDKSEGVGVGEKAPSVSC